MASVFCLLTGSVDKCKNRIVDVLDSIDVIHDLKYAQYNACPKKITVNQYVHLSSKCATFFLMHAYHFIFVDLFKSDLSSYLSW